MTSTSGVPDDKRMRLRYAGRCRLCSTPLAAGADAFYERSRRTVRCVACVPVSDAVAPAAEEVAVMPGGATGDATAPRTPDPLPTPALPHDALRLRPPAASVICETLRIQELTPPRSRAARVFGVSPLSADAEPWFLGALGELEVARVLDHLGDGWHVIHAVPVGTRGSDIDHLVIGPAGVFTINSKRHPGKVWVGARRLMVNGQRTDHLRNAEYEARRVAKVLNTTVRPVIAVVGARQFTIAQRPEKVVVLRSDALTPRLHRLNPLLTPEQVAALSARAADPATWGAITLEEPDLGAFAALRESIISARRVRRVWAFAVLAAALAALFAAPTVLSGAAGLLTASLAG